MEFKKVTPQAILLGTETIILSSGDRINIRKKVGSEITNILDEQVPDGKVWEIDLFIRSAEDNA